MNKDEAQRRSDRFFEKLNESNERQGQDKAEGRVMIEGAQLLADILIELAFKEHKS